MSRSKTQLLLHQNQQEMAYNKGPNTHITCNKSLTPLLLDFARFFFINLAANTRFVVFS